MAKRELLSDAEREQLLGIPTERDDLARLYSFEPTDIDLIRLLSSAGRPKSPWHQPADGSVSPSRHDVGVDPHRVTGLPELLSFIAEATRYPGRSDCGLCGPGGSSPSRSFRLNRH